MYKFDISFKCYVELKLKWKHLQILGLHLKGSYTHNHWDMSFAWNRKSINHKYLKDDDIEKLQKVR